VHRTMSFSEREKHGNHGRSGSGTVKILLVLLLLRRERTSGGPIFSASPAGRSLRLRPPGRLRRPSSFLHRIERADLAVGREYVGRVVADPDGSLRPQVSGRLSRSIFKEGSMVKAGQLLFTIDCPAVQDDGGSPKGRAGQAEGQLRQGRQVRPSPQGTDSRSVFRLGHRAAESDVLQRKAEVAQARATLQLAQIDLDSPGSRPHFGVRPARPFSPRATT
jgi:multidrug efflux pump subunit AcrA (membrane-fusion protein)